MPSNLAEKLTELAVPIVERNNAFIVDLLIRGERSSKVVELYVDADNGISLDRCALISREFSMVLDEADVIPGRYRLDVSSPGLHRPLKLRRQYLKNIGRMCKVIHKQNPKDASHGITVTQDGILEEVGESGIILSKAGKQFEIAFNDIVETYIIPQTK